MNRKISLLIFSFIFMGTVSAKEDKESFVNSFSFDEKISNAKSLSLPERGSVAGAYGNDNSIQNKLALGDFNLPIPLDYPILRGNLLKGINPTYSMSNGLSEFGMGFDIQGISLTRTRSLGDVQYNDGDEWTGLWGKLKKGNDGFWYPYSILNLKDMVRIKIDEDNGEVRAYLPDGSIYFFAKENAVTAFNTYTKFYLSIIQNASNETEELIYERNTTGKPFLKEVRYGGYSKRGTFPLEMIKPFQYFINFEYNIFESSALMTVNVSTGNLFQLDRRVKNISISLLSDNHESKILLDKYNFEYKWPSYGGAVFYLSSIGHDVYHHGKVAHHPKMTFNFNIWEPEEVKNFKTLSEYDELFDEREPNDIFSHKYSTPFDFDLDGLTTFEFFKTRERIKRNADGVIERYDHPNFDEMIKNSRCLSSTAPSSFSRLTGYFSSPKMLKILPNFDYSQDKTNVVICNDLGEEIQELNLDGFWLNQESPILNDLSSDGKIDLVKFFKNKVTILKNNSEINSNFISFDKNPKIIPIDRDVEAKSNFILDVTGSGKKSLVSKYRDRLSVWQGLGNLNFMGGETRELFFRTLEKRKFTELDKYEISFIDINKNGLLDVILLGHSNVIVFLNYGKYFNEIEISRLNDINKFSKIYPSINDFSGNGNSEINFFANKYDHKNNKIINLELNNPSTGFLSEVDDGKGNIISFEYEKTSPHKGEGRRIDVISKITKSSVGISPTSQTFKYQDLKRDNESFELLGFNNVSIYFDKLSELDVSFYHDNNLRSIPTKKVYTDFLDIGFMAKDEFLYDDGILLDQNLISRTGFSEKDFKILKKINSQGEITTFHQYDKYGCPQKTTIKNYFGILTHVMSYKNDDNFMSCVLNSEDIIGDSDKNRFHYSLELIRNNRNHPLEYRIISSDNQSESVLLKKMNYLKDGTYKLSNEWSPSSGKTVCDYDNENRLILVQKESGEKMHLTYDYDSDLPLKSNLNNFNINYDFNDFRLLSKMYYDQQNEIAQNFEYIFPKRDQLGISISKSSFNPLIAREKIVGEIDSGNGEKFASFTKLTTNEYLFEDVKKINRARKQISLFEKSVLSGSSLPINTEQLDDLYKNLSIIQLNQVTQDDFLLKKNELITENVLKKNRNEISLSEDKKNLVVKNIENGHLFETNTYAYFSLGANTLDLDSKLLNGHSSYTSKLLTHIDGRGEEFHFSYDSLGRFNSMTFPNQDEVTKTFNDFGLTKTIDWPHFVVSYSYDPKNLLLQEKSIFSKDDKRFFVESYLYDASGRTVSKKIKNSDNFTYSYNDKGLLSEEKSNNYSKTFYYRDDQTLVQTILKIKKNKAFGISKEYSNDIHKMLLSRSYDFGDKIIKTINHFSKDGDVNGLSFEINQKRLQQEIKIIYNEKKEIEKILFVKDGIPYDEILFGYDNKTGKILFYKKNGIKFDLEYNKRDLIESESVEGPNGKTISHYNYDEAKFLVSEERDLNKISYNYNANGELNLDKNVKTDKVFIYGENNRLKNIVDLKNKDYTLSYFYNSNNELLFKELNGNINYVYLDDGVKWSSEFGLLIPVKVNGKTVAILSEEGLISVLTDTRDSLIFENEGEAFKSQNTYHYLSTSYGLRELELSKQHSKKIRSLIDFASKDFDFEAGLINMGKRHYDPVAGIFTTPDPFFMENPEVCVVSPIECNLYSYAKNNPVSYVDPTGEVAWHLAGALIGGGMDLGAQLLVSNNRMATLSDTKTWVQVGVSAIVGVSGVGLGEVSAKAAATLAAGKIAQFGVRTALNAGGSALIGAGSTIATNAIHGRETTASGLISSMQTSAKYGAIGSIVGDLGQGAVNSYFSALRESSWSNASLSEKLMTTTLEPSKLGYSLEKAAMGAANIAGQVSGNASSYIEKENK